jgi:hypothetical protein
LFLETIRGKTEGSKGSKEIRPSPTMIPFWVSYHILLKSGSLQCHVILIQLNTHIYLASMMIPLCVSYVDNKWSIIFNLIYKNKKYRSLVYETIFDTLILKMLLDEIIANLGAKDVLLMDCVLI